jgi:hypothetical protein
VRCSRRKEKEGETKKIEVRSDGNRGFRRRGRNRDVQLKEMNELHEGI